jgi:hypothetical protein
MAVTVGLSMRVLRVVTPGNAAEGIVGIPTSRVVRFVHP